MLADCHKLLVTATKSLRTAEEQVNDARAFFHADNLRLIEKWTRLARIRELGCQIGIGVRFQGPSRDEKRMEVTLHPDLGRLTLPRAPTLRSVA
jgi:hypothetical protein